MTNAQKKIVILALGMTTVCDFSPLGGVETSIGEKLTAKEMKDKPKYTRDEINGVKNKLKHTETKISEIEFQNSDSAENLTAAQIKNMLENEVLTKETQKSLVLVLMRKLKRIKQDLEVSEENYINWIDHFKKVGDNTNENKAKEGLSKTHELMAILKELEDFIEENFWGIYYDGRDSLANVNAIEADNDSVVQETRKKLIKKINEEIVDLEYKKTTIKKITNEIKGLVASGKLKKVPAINDDE